MLQRAMLAVAALAAIAAAAGVAVVSLAFAFYALVKPALGQSGAAAAVAGVCALVIFIVGLVAAAMGSERRHEAEQIGLAEKLLELVRDKPMASAGVALAAGLMIVRNPAVLGVLLKALLEVWSGVDGGRGKRGK